MAIDAKLARRTIVEAEFRALQTMCQQAGNGPVWSRAIELLADYRFRDPLHQLIFDALRALPLLAPAERSAALIRRLTLQGFPDVDVEPFFHRHAMTAELALSIIEHLKFTARLDLTTDTPLR
ncbi:MAG: hypothetical protein ACRD5W_13995 [Candidatus Acidiferrales bacterium]